ncbi:hypothetical protein [Acetobacter oeni]|uniref:Uncharacterized protein n=1 Tax=Acetobacter oeni TaxID=304077 RepID=A0A511XFS0_9PROT|nr:hypothetical protein [Acetobacter oeni]MBB3882280.1 hypothetical protein [Acetobacter oeni]NHO18033.1 hypothetical protein [Acetobacter oeni]GBR01123.1 hypothetical protein AA21952_0319 [Acetobacter oeni LMG 21952]GEN61800.1 hypothetical protein AOE01nite_00240 [Acetobacter oeni]
MYDQLLRQRLRWYARTGGALLLRYWQWILLACILVPGTPVVSLFTDTALLMQLSITPGTGLLRHLLLIAGTEALAILWTLPQKEALSGGMFSHFSETLPLPRSTQTGVEATLLAVANSPALLVTGLAVLTLPPTQPALYTIWCLIALFTLAAIAQSAALHRRRLVMTGIVPASLALATGLAMPASPARWLLPALAIITACLPLFARHHSGHSDQHRKIRPKSQFATRVASSLTDRAPALLIQCKSLAERPATTSLRLIAALSLAVGADRLIRLFSFNARTPQVLILTMTVICLVLTGFYRHLITARHIMTPFLATLPLPRYYWLVRDTGFMLMLNTIPLMILCAPLILRGPVPVVTLLTLACYCQLLLALLRWPTLHGGRRSLLYGVLLSVAWSGAALAAVSP